MNDGPLYVVPDGVETRWASPENPEGAKGAGGGANAGRKGRAAVPIKDGDTLVLADESGTSGIVRRIWATINDRAPAMLRGLRLEVFWDGAETPAVSAPLGDFFGTGLGRMARFECALFGSPEGRSFNCRLPMPFRSAMRIAVTNESGRDLGSFFYDVDYTIGDDTADALYLHAHWRRENPTTMQRDYEILPRVEGTGRFLGSNIGVIADTDRYFNTWWGEGEVKVYLDGDTDLPTLCGTGTEDYIGTGWGQGRYARAYQGCHVADHENMQYCFYRYHIPDPVFFHQDARVTIQQIGCWSPNHIARFDHDGRPIYRAGPGREAVDFSRDSGVSPYGLFEREDDWSSCAYFYLDRPENALPELAPAPERTADLMQNPPVAGSETRQ